MTKNMIAKALGAVGGASALGGGGLLLAGIGGPWSLVAAGGGALALAGALLPRGDGEARRIATAPTAPATPDEFRQLKAELERRQRLEEQLTHAKHAAEAATMAKGEFLATMSHEIRTPLNGIIPLLDILLGSPLAPDQRDYAQTAYVSAQQLLRIVDDILDYSKLEANKLTLETVGINLKELLDAVMRLMDKSAENKGLALSLHIDPAVRLPVRTDPVRLRQVLTNLLSNAIKFTERGSVSLHVTRRGESRNHHELRFEVRDTGVGISPQAAAKLFKPFSQADTSTTRTFGGTGLGLVICKRIVDLMGGQLGVESTPGKGSNFWFNVPLLKALGDISTRHKGLAGARVMVLSADLGWQRKLCATVGNWGAMPVSANNTQEALNKLRSAAARGDSWAIDLLMVELPSVKATSIALHRSLQREQELSEIKVVYLRGDEPAPVEIQNSERFIICQRSLGEGELRSQVDRFLGEAAPATDSEPEITLRSARAIGREPPTQELPVPEIPARTAVATAPTAQKGTLPPAPTPSPPTKPAPTAPARFAEALPPPPTPRVAAAAPPAPAPPAAAPTPPRPAPRPAASTPPSLAPAPEALDPMLAMHPAPMAPQSSTTSSTGALAGHVLLVEDNPVNRQVAERLLSLAGLSVDSAEHGKEALEMMARGRYDAVLMDCQMPIMDGYTATRDRRTQEAEQGLERIPIIAMTANAMAGDREKCLECGMDDYLSKPINRALMSETLRRWLPAVPAAAAAAAAAPAPAAAPPPSAAPAAAPAAPDLPLLPTLTTPAIPGPMSPPPRKQAPMASPKGPSINMDVVEDLRDIMGAEFDSLVRVFLEDAPKALSKLEKAVLDDDIDAMVAPAHSLKSTSANLGAMELSAQAKHIEFGARLKNLSQIPERVTSLTEEFARARAELTRLIE